MPNICPSCEHIHEREDFCGINLGGRPYDNQPIYCECAKPAIVGLCEEVKQLKLQLSEASAQRTKAVSMLAGITAERDAALLQVSELQKQLEVCGQTRREWEAGEANALAQKDELVAVAKRHREERDHYKERWLENLAKLTHAERLIEELKAWGRCGCLSTCLCDAHNHDAFNRTLVEKRSVSVPKKGEFPNLSVNGCKCPCHAEIAEDGVGYPCGEDECKPCHVEPRR